VTSFESLGLAPDLLRAVADEGYTIATPIQSQAIPLVLGGRDVIGAAQTGTGKTAAFVLPILQQLLPRANTSFSPARHQVQALVLTPTRELAIQVAEMAASYGRHVPLRSAVVFGGVPLEPQIKELARGVELLVATPGRLLDLVGQRAANLGQVEILVLDEADRMLDMGFIPDVRRIVELLPRRRQTLLYSATFPDPVRRLAAELLRDPATVEVGPRNATATAVREVLYPVDRERKLDLLEHLVDQHDLRQVLVFTRTKVAARRLAADLDRDGYPATAIHSDRTQAERIRALADFRAGTVDLLVATDVASRGLDIEELPIVVNFELPSKAEDYIHRIGRTGRAGASGIAISLACPDEVDLLRAIQRLLRRAIPVEVVEDFLPDPATPVRPLHPRGPWPIPLHPHKAGRLRHVTSGPPARP
jgi:ATP-dependent RNA helicase RhlE